MSAYRHHFCLQNTTTFSSYTKSLSSGDVHLVVPDEGQVEAPQVFIVIDNDVLMETHSFTNGLFAFFGVHFVFQLEYTKRLRQCFQFLEEYLFGIQQKKRTMDYRKGVTKTINLNCIRNSWNRLFSYFVYVILAYLICNWRVSVLINIGWVSSNKIYW